MTQTPVTPAPQTVAPDGSPVDVQPQFVDYWGTDEVFRFDLQGDQYFEYKAMNEGAKAMFQKLTNKGLRVNQRTQDATIDVDPANERWTLIKESVVGWKLYQRDLNDPRGFSEFPAASHNDSQRKRQIEQILEKFNPKVIQDLEFEIRKANPWMQADMDVEEIDKEIDRLVELKRQKLEHDAGEGSSANK